ncbi:MAG: polysaccharide biosynthesis tyrosine autokinase [Flavobacteriales bacterium]|nr:polysaccharide biosynthesis tyrosine autokinase [Flavobacteriales bacterium]
MTHQTLAPAPEKTVTLLDIVNAVLGGWKTIALVTTLIVLGALLFLLIGKPIYQVNAVIQIDQSSKGMSSQLAPIEAMLTGTLPSDGEIELIRSRSVVGRAVDKYHLEISTRAKRLFLIGGIAAAINKGAEKPVAPWLWMSSYGWGGESLKINVLSVPKSLLGETLILTTLKHGMFKLTDPDGKLLFEGEVGKRLSHKQFFIHVSQLRARPRTEFEVVASSRYDTVIDLQSDLEISELGRQSGVIQIVYNNSNSALAVGIVNSIVDEHARQNIARKAEEARKTLAFLTIYLPKSKDNLALTERALSNFQSQHGTVAIEQETKGLLDRTVMIESQLEQLKLERQDLRQRFSNFHPNIITLDNKILALKKSLSAEYDKMQTLPAIQRELLGLTREVSVSTEMYTYLMNRTQELRLMEAGTVGDIRIIDRAEKPFEPIFPIPSVVIAVATFLGLMLGTVIVVLRLSLRHGVKTAEDIETATGGVVYAVLPFAENQAKLPKNSNLLAKEEPKNVTVEALRNFVVNLHFTLVDTKKQSIAISGISPNAGKSFVSANLAYLLAQSGKRVLLVDTDMRKGYLAETFNAKKTPGLSELLASNETSTSFLNKVDKNLTLITSGLYPPNPVDLLMSPRFEMLMQAWEQDYDFIIMDTPPVLSVADATIIAEQVGSTFLVVRAEENSADDILAAARRFENINQPVHGYLLNGFIPDLLSAKGYGKYAYYGYGAYTDDK